jgi:hypothetical protein
MRTLVMTAAIAGPRPHGSPRNCLGVGQVSIDVAYTQINFIDVMVRRGDPGYASSWPYVSGPGSRWHRSRDRSGRRAACEREKGSSRSPVAAG